MSAGLRLSAGLLAWSAVFVALYALHGFGCAAGWDGVRWGGWSQQTAALLGAWTGGMLGTLALAVWLQWRAGQDRDFAGRVAVALGWTGFVATVFTGAPLAMVPACL